MAPELTVVIPTRNRCDLLRRCLQSLAGQRADPATFEVVVVVDGSTDGTEEMLERLPSPFPRRVLTQPGVGQGAARNAGAALADGAHLLFLDDDMTVSDSLVDAHLRAHSGRADLVCLGRIRQRAGPDSDRLARARAVELDGHYERLAGRTPSFRDCYSGNLSLSRRLYEHVGGFASDLTRVLDVELGYRLMSEGAEFAYVPEALSIEAQTLGWRALTRDAESRGVESLELYRRHPAVLPSLELGGYGAHDRRTAALRRVLLTLRLPSRAFALAGTLIPGRDPAVRRTGLIMDYAYWRGVRRGAGDRDEWRRLARGVTILFYHAVGRSGERASRYVVPATRFERQMKWLRRLGYSVISLDELLECRRRHRLAPSKAVVITLDDGYADNLELAYPVLERLGFPATIFVVSGRRQNDWDGEGDALRDRALLSPGGLRGQSPMLSFGAHTRTHPDLTSIPASRLQEEVSGSRSDLEHALGRPVTTFAYPYGSSDSVVRAAVEQAGFDCALTAISGSNRPATDRFALLRTEVRGTDSLPRFLLTLLFGNTHISRRGRDAS